MVKNDRGNFEDSKRFFWLKFYSQRYYALSLQRMFLRDNKTKSSKPHLFICLFSNMLLTEHDQSCSSTR